MRKLLRDVPSSNKTASQLNIPPGSAMTTKSVSRNREIPRRSGSRKGTSYIPYPQRDRIKQKFVAGKNISVIAREECRHWESVAKIVKEPDVQEHVNDLRARFYGALEGVLIAAIEYAKTGKDGGWLAFEMLERSGVIPERDKEHLQAPGMTQSAVPDPESEEAAVKRIALEIVEGAIWRHRAFGIPLPEA